MSHFIYILEMKLKKGPKMPFQEAFYINAFGNSPPLARIKFAHLWATFPSCFGHGIKPSKPLTHF